MGRRTVAPQILRIYGYVLARRHSFYNNGKEAALLRQIMGSCDRQMQLEDPHAYHTRMHQALVSSSTITSFACKSSHAVVSCNWNKITNLGRRSNKSVTTEETVSPESASGFSSSTGIYKSLRRQVDIPDDEFLNFPSLVFSHTDRSDKVALIDAPSGRAVTFGELKQQVLALAAGLGRMGVKQGDVVMMVLPNSIEYPLIFLAVMWMGAVITPINPLSKTLEIETLMKDSNPRLIVTISEEIDKVATFGLPLVLLGRKGEADKLNQLSKSSIVTLGELLDSDPFEAPIAKIRQDDTAALMYSSGTTGLCKGVVWSHRNIIAATLQFNENPPEAEELGVCLLPMYHTFGFCIITCTHFRKGTPLVVIPRFDLEELLCYIERYRLSSITVVPPILVSLTKSTLLDKYDLSTLRTIECGAAPLGKEVMDVCRSRLPGVKFKQVAPAEIEALLLSHPLIRDAAVIPFPDEDAGQIPMAVVVKSLENGLNEDDVINFIAQQVFFTCT
ncbi:hypothetical protein O6H91_03G090700 [Diphasiastrum complanatum]|uniref:Uncharacterized protein n=1 Tax=Diphasiastrum complanatum TaxID=34168 RepID=A0ACC2E8K2_DIPCM|nr:hypothetical protein O6H91_03G090700 [Diphasiastrum complanatum]